jgi:uncharacterized membrane protein
MLIEDELHIEADIARVWALTVDVESLPAITPTMTSVVRLDEGPFGVGSQARIVQPRQGSRIWTVTRFEAPHEFEWEARLGPLVMTGGHHLTEVEGGTLNRLTIEIGGPASGVVGRLFRKQVAAAIHTENEGFRRAATAASG